MKKSLESSPVGLRFNFGQSGSTFEVVQTKSGPALRKSKLGDSRLLQQFEKHSKAQGQSLRGLKTPRVLSGFHDFGYLMELVHAIPIGQALGQISLPQINDLSAKFTEYFTSIWSHSVRPDESFAHLLDKKIRSLENYALKQENPIFRQAINVLFQNQELALMSQGWNHGDFSYENILISQNGTNTEVYMVDFLDSPFDSPLLDFGRFWLDMNYGWWGNRFEPSSTWIINNKLLRENFLNLLDNLGILFSSVLYFTLIASLRIVPYTKNPVRIAHLKTSIIDITKRSEQWRY